MTRGPWTTRGAGLFAGLSACLILVACPALLSGQVELPTEGAKEPFPHADHEGLFPLCAGCHLGAGDDRSASLYPEPESCAGCHDGGDLNRVDWESPAASASHLLFEHGEHRSELRRAGDEPATCASCHAPSQEERWAVVPVSAQGCWTCHKTPDHYSSGTCTSCHLPLSSSTLAANTVTQWTAPADHEDADFLGSVHGKLDLRSEALARCATCHTQDQCMSCHVDGNRVEVQSLGTTAPQLESLTIAARYPEPTSHQAATFLDAHGDNFQPSQCSTCHTRDDCMACHVGPASQSLDALTPRRESKAPGVELLPAPPVTHAAPTFRLDHGDIAAAAEGRCTTCHLPAECTTCHVGGQAAALPATQTVPLPASVPAPVSLGEGADVPETRLSPWSHQPLATALDPQGGFHASDFVMTHSTDAWNGLLECSNCHDTQVFCRSCHVESGLASTSRLGPGYHDAEPLWLLRHGQSARQALESCASCHRQKECLQCHSTTGAFRVSPHGSDFDADDVREKAGRTCYACHLGGPPREGGPDQ